MATDFGDYAYACTYWRHMRHKVDFGPDLEGLVRENRAAEDREERSTEGYYVATEAGWEPVGDLLAPILAKLDAEEDAEVAELKQHIIELVWQVHIEGPDGTSSFEWRFATEAEAIKAAATYPPHVHATVKHA